MALYMRQPFPDNYVPESFLDKLVTNGMYLCVCVYVGRCVSPSHHEFSLSLFLGGISRPELLSIFLGTAGITQQISTVILFLVRRYRFLELSSLDD